MRDKFVDDSRTLNTICSGLMYLSAGNIIKIPRINVMAMYKKYPGDWAEQYPAWADKSNLNYLVCECPLCGSGWKNSDGTSQHQDFTAVEINLQKPSFENNKIIYASTLDIMPTLYIPRKDIEVIGNAPKDILKLALMYVKNKEYEEQLEYYKGPDNLDEIKKPVNSQLLAEEKDITSKDIFEDAIEL